MKQNIKCGLLVLFSFKSAVAVQRDDNENRPSISIPKRIGFPSRLPKRNQSKSLYDRAFELTGDTPFSRKLLAEELKEEQRCLALQERKRASSTSILFSFLFIPIILGSTKYGFAATIQETMAKSLNLLFLAWLPALFLTVTWIEILSVAWLLVRPPIWIVVNDFLSNTWASLKKLLLSELWRHFWKHATKTIPMPILSPSGEYLELTPRWFQAFWSFTNKVTDKYVQGLLRKSFQESLGIAVGAIFESLMNRCCNAWGLGQHKAAIDSSSGHQKQEINVKTEIGPGLPAEEIS